MLRDIAYGGKAGGPLGRYNFAGDLGETSLPPAVSLLPTVMNWRPALWVVAGLGTVVGALIGPLMPPAPGPPVTLTAPEAEAAGRGGFGLLLSIDMLDSNLRPARDASWSLLRRW